MSHTQTPDTGRAEPEQTGSAAGRATVLAGVGSVADVAAVAQLATTGANTGVLVTGLLSVLAGFLGLVAGRPTRRRATLMTMVVAVGAGMAGAALHGYWVDASAERTGTTTTAATSTTASRSSGSVAATSSTTSATTTVASGSVIRTESVTLRDQDYLDVETGRIGEVEPGASDLWYVGPYRELWTSGGGELPITPIAGQPDATACTDELGRRSYDQVSIGQLAPGAWICARTAEDNVVAVQVTAVPTGDDPLAITYTVWQA
ncbi:hypothetical protein [Saccharothrix luteola]|uniref:hypothetical protein n=1 Tax=Saccharothrix luteola TaxID=2893018 RepID=UPI001E41D891|nr:hypothetical protein [Saccharothrix luteola]MCC8242811.1 hypothetical protein [Saccharothrix luteola]